MLQAGYLCNFFRQGSAASVADVVHAEVEREILELDQPFAVTSAQEVSAFTCVKILRTLFCARCFFFFQQQRDLITSGLALVRDLVKLCFKKPLVKENFRNFAENRPRKAISVETHKPIAL